MHESVLHVTFGESAYGALRLALVKAGRHEEVISLTDALNFGPIDSPDLQKRFAWVEKEFGFEAHDGVDEAIRVFWKKFHSDKRHKVLWTSRRSALEYCGFLECLWQLGDTPCSFIDLTDVKVVTRDQEGNLRPPAPAICLPYLGEETIIRNGILDMAQPLSVEDRQRYHAIWKQLRTENAPFRVIGEEGIASAPITYFDGAVLSWVKGEWQKSARVIGEVMGEAWSSNYIQVGDWVYFSRLQKLAEAGVVESRGDMSKMRFSEVRLPATGRT